MVFKKNTAGLLRYVFKTIPLNEPFGSVNILDG